MSALLSERVEPLMEKPGWQRIFILAASLMVLFLALYQFGLRELWQQQETLRQEIAIAQQAISLAQVTLMHQPPLEKLQRELADNAVFRRNSLPLEQQFAQPLKDAQAVLIHWQPVSQHQSEPQGELQLQVTFSGLMHFLYALLQHSEPPAFSELNLHTTGAGMKASVLMTQTEGAGDVVAGDLAIKTGRDPFRAPQAPTCIDSPLSDWLLSGISDADGHRYGWLLSPQGGWNKVETGSRFGTPQWTVEALNGAQMELSLSDIRCGMQHQIIRLGKAMMRQGKEK